MKQYAVLIIISILFIHVSYAQNVGINNTDPQVSLDINGAFANRSVSLNPFLNAVNLPSNISFGIIEPTDVDGPVSIIDPEIWIDGRRLVLWNNTGFVATFAGVSIEPNGVRDFICKATAGGWKPVGDGASQLEKITEGASSGWRLLGRNPNFYGAIGTNAVDFSYSYIPSLTLGATGEASSTFGFSTTASDVASLAAGFGSTASGYVSLSFGLNSIASGYISTAIGNTNIASGSMTTALGRNTIARSYASVAIGRYNDTIVGTDQLSWIENDPIFTIGNGVDALSRRNAMVVYKNGTLQLQNQTSTPANITDKFYVLNNIPYFGSNKLESSQLEKITEGGKTGWRLLGRDAANYGDIGNDAVDFSFSSPTVNPRGATGTYATAFGANTTASGSESTSLGIFTIASGKASTATGTTTVAKGENTFSLGFNTIARSYASLAIGSYNDTIVGSNMTSWVATDPLLTVGNGTSTVRSNAMTVYKNGNTDISGYTKLGKVSESAPSIKMKKIVNTGPSLNGNKLIPHGLDAAKILEIEILMEWQLEGFPASPTRVVPPNFTSLSGLNYQYELLDGNIIIYNINGTEIAGRNLRILITYEE
ncbi:MAG TPA: hypothetical protein VK169_22465 [Saprospiraceae bacterium]|nr:hypothetical protein [Saprospiraceae bacterium]